MVDFPSSYVRLPEGNGFSSKVVKVDGSDDDFRVVNQVTFQVPCWFSGG